MSFKRFENDDFVVSAEAVATGTWSENNTKLTTFFTSSNQEGSTSGKFYLNIFNEDPSSNDSAEIQFGLAYGNKEGSGSLDYNSSVPGVSPSSTIFNQTKMQVLGDENGEFLFGSTPSEEIYVISVNRDRYKESMVPGSLLLHLSSSTHEIYLTDNSGDITGQQIQKFTDAGRVFDLKLSTKISSSVSQLYSGSYGWFLPDTGLIILNPEAVNLALNDAPSISANSNDNVPSHVLNWFQEFELLSQETISSNFLFIRPRSSEFNYSSNPSYVDSTTGEVLYEDFINNPKSYITTIGIYNDSNELLAVAKLSKPLEKNSTKEALVRVKLDF